MKYLFPILSSLLLMLTGCASSSNLTLAGNPTVELTMDRSYSVISTSGGVKAYMLAAGDGDSSAVVLVGDGGFRKTKEEIAKEYGKVEISKEIVNGADVSWMDYKETKHLYSTVDTTVIDDSGKKVRIYMDLVANSSERMAALKKSFERITLK